MIDFLFGSQIELQLCSLIQIRNVTWVTLGDRYSTLLAAVVAIFYSFFPIALSYLLWRHAKNETIESKTFNRKYGTLTSELRLRKESRTSLFVPIILWTRASSLVVMLFSDSTTV